MQQNVGGGENMRKCSFLAHPRLRVAMPVSPDHENLKKKKKKLPVLVR